MKWLICAWLVLICNSLAAQQSASNPEGKANALPSSLEVRVVAIPEKAASELAEDARREVATTLRETQDLEAQQIMAYWARVQAFAGIFALIASIVSIAFLYRSIKQTGQSIKISADALKLSSTSLELAEIASKQEHERSIESLRAYVFVESAALSNDLDNLDEELSPIRCTIKNFGATPAANCTVSYKVAKLSSSTVQPSGTALIELLGWATTGRDKVSLAPTAKYTCPIASEFDIPDALDKRHVIYLHGEIRYQDVFSQHHSTKFCLALDEKSGEFLHVAENCDFD